ncbi:hypothetical protein PML95_07675 [Vagococcus lutrae]|uniref:Lipoprotein n=1 Tax=Vagococcus lutrae TaxID=81947 RepID=A0AAE9XDT2_9ENTE|nr:hypothetical protein [Vagococcus lutrae]WCG22273.1 hypothetical protein PML95_07675 [Vagococcus lutrae]GEQ60673.1 lipoprotein [Vagococcus lutrae]GEQ62567.1 lipoprotein [Vagococcus lutrae]GEQ64655.1 lipoprotein [Vagococcus lutrae]
MKKIMIGTTLLLGTLFLVACQNKTEDVSEATEESIVETQTASETVWHAVVKEDATKSQETIMVMIEQIDPIQDSEEIFKMVGEQGVQLNISEDQLKDGLTVDELKKGESVSVTLSETPIMTNSLPPQIPGNSVVAVSKVNK